MNILLKLFKTILFMSLSLVIIINLYTFVQRIVLKNAQKVLEIPFMIIAMITILGIICLIPKFRDKEIIRRVSLTTTVIVTVLLLTTGSTLSRYKTNIGGHDSTSAARMVLGGLDEITLKTSDFSLQPGSEADYEFEVCNFKDLVKGEVTQRYTITLTTTSNLPLSFSLSYKVDDNETINTIMADITDTTTSSEITLPCGADERHRYFLKVKWQEGEYQHELSSEIDNIEIKIQSVQVNR